MVGDGKKNKVEKEDKEYWQERGKRTRIKKRTQNIGGRDDKEQRWEQGQKY